MILYISLSVIKSVKKDWFRLYIMNELSSTLINWVVGDATNNKTKNHTLDRWHFQILQRETKVSIRRSGSFPKDAMFQHQKGAQLLLLRITVYAFSTTYLFCDQTIHSRENITGIYFYLLNKINISPLFSIFLQQVNISYITTKLLQSKILVSVFQNSV